MIIVPIYINSVDHFHHDLEDVGRQWVVAHAPIYNERGEAQAYADALVRAKPIVGAAIIARDGVVAATSGETPALLSGHSDLVDGLMRSAGDRLEAVFGDFETGAAQYVAVRLDSTDVNAELNEYVATLGAVALLISIVVTVVSVIAIVRFVVQPLRRLRSLLDAEDTDALSAFAASFHADRDDIGAMVARIARLVTDNAAYRDNLSRIVLERTFDLSAANSKLRDSQRKIAESETRFRAILDNSPFYIFLKNRDGRYQLVNKHAEKALNRPASEIIGKRNADLFPDHLIGPYNAQDEKVFVEGVTTVEEHDVPLADGALRSSLIYKFPILGGGGVVESLGAVVVDIHDRKRAEAEIAEQGRVLRKVLENIDSGVLMLDREMKVETFNERFLALNGLPDGAIVAGASLRDAFETSGRRDAGTDRKENLADARRWNLIDRSAAQVAQEHEIDGRIIETHWTSSPDGSQINIATDITERKQNQILLERARDTAERAAKSRSELVAVVSHEVRTPMNGVLGMARLLQETPLDEQQKDMLATIVQSGDNLVRIVSDLLDVSKIEAGKFELEIGPFILVDVVEECLAIMRSRAKEKSIALELEINEELPDVLIGDPYRLRQVVTNLVSNAIRFTNEGSVRVKIQEIARHDGEIRLAFNVIDTGVGIKADDVDRLFTPYEQGSLRMARKSGGTGLGLVICARLVERMGGVIMVDSVFGEGSVFSFELTLPIDFDTPAHRLREQARNPSRLGGSAGDGQQRPMSILHAEDNPVNQRVVDGILANAGHSVTIVPNGAEALDALKTQRFDAIVMDRHMPVTDGIEATRAIRALRDGVRDIPIIGLTASAIESELEICRVAGMNAVLTKPVEGDELLSAIARLADGGGTRDQPPAGARVLVIDDVRTNRAVAQQQLRWIGLPSVVAESGAEAIALIENDRFDVICVDINMPGMSGVEFAIRVRNGETKADPKIPIIAMTGHTSADEHVQYRAAGIDDVLTKPIVVEDLAAVLNAALDRNAPPSQPSSALAEDVTDRAAAAVIDLDLLGEIIGEEGEAEKRYWVAEFVADFPPVLAEIRRCAEAADRDALARAAHAAKSAANSVAALRLAAATQRLEREAAAADQKELDALVADIDACFLDLAAFNDAAPADE